MTIHAFSQTFVLRAALAAAAQAATATLEGGTVTLREGESASFPIRGGSDGRDVLSRHGLQRRGRQGRQRDRQLPGRVLLTGG
ncbi:MAG: hypothetical protein H5U13_06975 [Parvibaculum sp.]|nr:hypothetical protein [Parvibaculum sp.]